jgi:fructose/tagatose bisphosphate aldolase
MRACGSAWIEAELGALPGDEDVSTNALPSQTMTDPRQAREFVERTGIDALAVAVGNVHGFTACPVTLDLERLHAIAEKCPVPLVLHGASGLPPEQLRGALSWGSSKSTSTPNSAAPTSAQSNAHCRRRCRPLTPSPYGRRDAPLSRPRH